MDLFPQPPFRSFSTALTASASSSSTSITRVASGPMMAINMSMNRLSLASEHLFTKCKRLLVRLAAIDGMRPYLEQANAAAERCAEQQALALSQQLQQTDSLPSPFRSLMGSGGFSIYSDHSSNSLGSLSAPLTNNIFTFTAGVLPASMALDPVTQVWKLFQNGVPLCLIFNVLRPEHAIPVQPSSDLRMCKKAVYDFVVAVKTHMSVDEDSMFTISNVFSDNTNDLLRIISVIVKLLDSNEATRELPVDELAEEASDLKITDDRSKVFRELIQTERKYISDLELLLRYKDELQAADALSSEQLHVLFPNLSDIVDFHRRLLTGLECNIDVPPKYQRIGSVFIHASNGPFRAYEPWTIGQIGAIELINREASNLKRASSLIDPGFGLQSFIIKPIQRLCKYPLLLKELIKAYTDVSDATYFNELLMANAAMKEVANQVNEAQRRSENIGYLQNLVDRVKNWRGFNLREQGELLYHSTVSIKDGDSDKEYVAYLFERIIFFFIETSGPDKSKEKKKRDLLGSRKKLNSNPMSGSTANLLESLNGVKDSSTLELKGRVYISEIYNISAANMNGHTLVISWSGKKESGSFVLRYRTEESRNQWENCLRHLKANEMNSQLQRKLRDSRGLLGTNYSFEGQASTYGFHVNSDSPLSQTDQRHVSLLLTFSMMKMSKNGGHHSQSGETLGGPLNGIHIRVIYNQTDVGELLSVLRSIGIQELQQRIASFVASLAIVEDDILINKLKYKDEEGDLVVMSSADDWQLAVDMVDELGESDVLTIWAS